jgi:hypothetical protein
MLSGCHSSLDLRVFFEKLTSRDTPPSELAAASRTFSELTSATGLARWVRVAGGAQSVLRQLLDVLRLSIDTPAVASLVLRPLAAHTARGGALHGALLQCAGEASLAVTGCVLRCGLLPELAVLDALDVLCEVLNVGAARGGCCCCGAAAAAAAAAALAAAAAAPLWLALGGGGGAAPAACGCSVAEAVRCAFFKVGARLFAAAASGPSAEAQLAGLLGAPAALAGGGGGSAPPRRAPLVALVAALETALRARCAPPSPLLPSPAEPALHLLLTVARLGGHALARLAGGAPVALYGALCGVVADARARAPLRVAAARFLYLASGAGGGGAAALRVSGAPALALALLQPRDGGRGSERSRALRAALRSFAALTLRNLLLTFSSGVGDTGSDNGGVPAALPGAPLPPPLPPGNALPALPRRPCAAQHALWAALSAAALANCGAAAALVALLAHTAAASAAAAAALVECNPSAMEACLAALLASEDAALRPAARRAAPLLWRLAAERGRAVARAWAGALAAWLPWRGGQVKRLRAAEAAAGATDDTPTTPGGSASYDWEKKGSPWVRYHTAGGGWPYFFHSPSRRSQWALPTSDLPPSRAPHGVAVVEAPLEADADGVPAVLALAESGVLLKQPAWWAGEDVVMACVAAAVAEGCAEAPPATASAGTAAATAALTHWPHLPLCSNGCHWGGAQPLSPRLTAAAAPAKAFLAAATAALGGGPPLPLWLSPALAASVARLARCSPLPLPAAFAAVLRARCCAEPAAVDALCAALAEVGELGGGDSVEALSTLPFAQPPPLPPLPVCWERGAPGSFCSHGCAQEAGGAPPPPPSPLAAEPLGLVALLAPERMPASPAPPLPAAALGDAAGGEEAAAAHHACVASPFQDAVDGCAEPLNADVGKALPRFAAGTPWQHVFEAKEALTQQEWLAASAPT